MPFRITETAGFIALSLAGRLEAWTAACWAVVSASCTRLSSCLTCSRNAFSSSCVCAPAVWGRPSAAATASAMVPFLCIVSLRVHAIADAPRGRSRTRSLRASEAGYRATELGENWRCARIECDSRRKRKRKGNRRNRRQGNVGWIDRKRKGRQRAVHRVIRDALLGRVTDWRDALAAALGLGQVALDVRQRVQLRRLLGEDQRGSEKQVAQCAFHGWSTVYSKRCDRSSTPRTVAASARGGSPPRPKASPSAARTAARCRWARRSPRSSR